MNQVARKIAASKWWPCRAEHLLTVVGSGSVFAEEMLVEQSLGNWLYRWIELKSFPGHFRNDFQGMGIFDSLCAGGSPCKRSVPGDQDRTDLFGIEIVEPLDNDIAGFPLVGAFVSPPESSDE